MVKRGSATKPPGFVLLDCMAALVLLTGAVFVLVTFFRAEVREIRATHERFAAQLLAESEMARLRLLPYEDLKSGEQRMAAEELPALKRLKEGRVKVAVEEIESGLKEITVRVEWESPRGRALSAELTGVFAEEARPG